MQYRTGILPSEPPSDAALLAADLFTRGIGPANAITADDVQPTYDRMTCQSSCRPIIPPEKQLLPAEQPELPTVRNGLTGLILETRPHREPSVRGDAGARPARDTGPSGAWRPTIATAIHELSPDLSRLVRRAGRLFLTELLPGPPECRGLQRTVSESCVLGAGDRARQDPRIPDRCRAVPASLTTGSRTFSTTTASDRNGSGIRPNGLVIDGGTGGLCLRDWAMTMDCVRRFPGDHVGWGRGRLLRLPHRTDRREGRQGRCAGTVRCSGSLAVPQFRALTRSATCRSSDRMRLLAYCPEARRILERKAPTRLGKAMHKLGIA